MRKKTEPLQEYLEFRRLQEDLMRSKKTRKQTLLLSAAILYILIILALSTFLRPQTYNFLRRDSSVDLRVEILEKQMLSLGNESESMKKILIEGGSDQLSYGFLKNKITELENSQKSLYESVLLKPEDVVTAQLLTEKLNLQNEQLTSLKDDFRRLNESLDHIMWAVIILPLLGIFGFLFKEKFLKKNEPLF